MEVNLNNVINLRGLRQQAFTFAVRANGKRQKQCFHKGCELFTPIQHAISGVEIGNEIEYQKVFYGEVKIDTENIVYTH